LALRPELPDRNPHALCCKIQQFKHICAIS